MWGKNSTQNKILSFFSISSIIQLLMLFFIYDSLGEPIDDSSSNEKAVHSIINLNYYAIATTLILNFSIATIFIKYFNKNFGKLIFGINQFLSDKSEATIEIGNNEEFGELTKGVNQCIEEINRQKEFLNNIPTPIMAIDKDFNIQYMNKLGASLTGKSQKELIGLKCYDQMKTNDCQTNKCACSQAMKKDKVASEETIARPNNLELPILYTGKSTKNKMNEITGAIEFITDLSEAKQKEIYLQKSSELLLEKMIKFSNGDLTIELNKENKNEIIDNLFDGFNNAVTNMKELVLKVSDSIQSTSTASFQISSSTEELASGSEEQTSQTMEIASAMEQMTKTVFETTRNTASASESSKDAGKLAHEGGKVVENAITGMRKISDVVHEAVIKVTELGESSGKIGQITQVIDEIADQTNLLALNAAIEAARAGEHGRGFAVVADEVRKLAERTSTATQEITDMITKIQFETDSAVTSIRNGSGEVSNGMKLAIDAGEMMKQVVAAVNKAVDQINQVATASEEQAATVEQISKGVDSISNVASESSNSIQQVAHAAENLNNLTMNLQELIDNFKIKLQSSPKSFNVVKMQKEFIESV